jgi:hypothetical protein
MQHNVRYLLPLGYKNCQVKSWSWHWGQDTEKLTFFDLCLDPGQKFRDWDSSGGKDNFLFIPVSTSTNSQRFWERVRKSWDMEKMPCFWLVSGLLGQNWPESRSIFPLLICPGFDLDLNLPWIQGRFTMEILTWIQGWFASSVWEQIAKQIWWIIKYVFLLRCFM